MKSGIIAVQNFKTALNEQTRIKPRKLNIRACKLGKIQILFCKLKLNYYSPNSGNFNVKEHGETP